MSSLRMSSLQLHELYQELVSVGFGPREALFLTAQVLVSGVLSGERYEIYEDEDGFDEEDGNSDGEFD